MDEEENLEDDSGGEDIPVGNPPKRKQQFYPDGSPCRTWGNVEKHKRKVLARKRRRERAAAEQKKPKKKQKWTWGDIEKHKEKARRIRREREAVGDKTWTKEMYAEYLKSDHWKNLRTMKYASTKPSLCAICGSTKDLQVHHLQYKNVYDVALEDLVIVCDRCHDLIHELLRSGKLRIQSDTPSDRIFVLTKVAVEKAIAENLPSGGRVQ